MMLQNLIYYSLIGILMVSCNSYKSTLKPEEIKAFGAAVSVSDSLIIESNYAYPRMTGALMDIQNSGFFPMGNVAGNIDISGTLNYLIINKGNVTAELPYYGERNVGGYNQNIGIQFKGQPDDYTIKNNEEGSYIITFSMKDRINSQENYEIQVYLYPNYKTRLIVNSSHRTSIQYSGNLSIKKM